MADNKKYYYMRLKDNFFEDETMVFLESMQDGYLYSNILLKLYLKSIKTEGKLLFNNFIPYSAEMIATITRHQVGVVKEALKIFEQLGLIEVLDNGVIYMMNIQSYIGKSSTEADRKRAYRAKIESEKERLGHLSSKCPPEIEIELEKDIEIEIEKEKEYIVDFKNEINEIITYLNQKTDSRFKASTLKTQSLIKARLKEGYTVNDFYTVIDKKYADWKGTEYEKFLRPETLFGNKFEGYLNQKIRNNKQVFDVFGQVLEGSVTIHDTTGNGNDSEDAEGLLSLPF